MNKKYQIPYFLVEDKAVKNKVAIVEAPTEYAATLMLAGAYSKAGVKEVRINYDGVVEIVEINSSNDWTIIN